MKSLILLTYLLHAALAAPQLISFKDGKVGVNFLGYHAEAGLGGGQNGGGLLGGLHASAGTPWGQNAAAGLGGNVNGRAAGVLYAGAQATPDVGASALLGGDTSQGGFSGSEAHANGKVNSHTRTVVASNTQKGYDSAVPQYPPQPAAENDNAIQKIRPPKKYHSSEPFDNANIHEYSVNNNGVKTPAATAIVLTKTITKTIFATPHPNNGKYHIALDANENNNHNHFTTYKLNTTSSALSATPSVIPPSVSLGHSLNGDNLNGANNPTAIIITRDRTKPRTHAHKHRRNHQPKRIISNRQRQRSKTIVKSIDHKQEQQLPVAELQNNASTLGLFPIDEQQQSIPKINHDEQRTGTRKLVAPTPGPYDLPAPVCDKNKQECKNVHREVRSDVVQNALQIPIGILQSLQKSLGNLGSH